MTQGAHPSVLDIYQRHGRAWSTLRTQRLVERLWLVRFCALVPGESTILDIGCGSGVPIARELTGRGFAVIGVDGSSTMLALFRRNCPDLLAHHVDMRELALGRSFAGLIAWDSLFHLSPDDQRAMFPRLRAHAAAGTALMFTSGNVEGDAIGVLEGEPLYHGSLSAGQYRQALDAAGFDVIDHVADDPSCGGRTIWLARQRG